ncbi:MAG: hypothetical protein ABI348_09240 [Nitrososphaera sp.]
MGGLYVTPSLRDALLDLYFRETCDQEGWAYAAPADVLFTENTLAFSKGQRKVQVKVHGQLVQEIEKTAPVFDYLACKVGNQEEEGVVVASPLALCWVKTRNGKDFTDGQLDAMGGGIRLPVVVFRVRDVLAPPAKLETRWEAKSGKEWLDEIDEKREEAESDDDYL